MKSSGCNYLIRHNKAILLTKAEDLLEIMGWMEKKKHVKRQKELFIELSPDEKRIVGLLQTKETTHIDEINISSGLSSSATAAAILNLELQGVVGSLPGKMYKLL
jgi:DNA processing protein